MSRLSEKSSLNICLTARGFISSLVRWFITNSSFPPSSFTSCARILLHEDSSEGSVLSKALEKLVGPTIHQPRRVLIAYGSSILPVTISYGLMALGQLQPIKRPMSISLSSSGIFSLIL